MKKRLWLNAFLISPVIALYGIWPFYANHNLGILTIFLLFVGITTTSLFLWSIHIYFALKCPRLNNFWKFIISYALMATLKFSMEYLIPIDNLSDLSKENDFIFEVFISLLPNAIILILCNSIVTEHKRVRAEQELQELKFQNSEAQKQVLTQQLHPHFLFNALGVLKSLIATNQKSAQDYTLRLSHFLQYSIHSHKKSVVTLEKELQFVNDYISLQKVRFGEAFTSQIDIPVEVMGYRIPVFALQTLVENIFKHNNFTEKKPLSFSISYIHNNHNIVVRNRKKISQHVECNNTGLANLNSRYLLINERGIEIEETENEFIVTIPVIKP